MQFARQNRAGFIYFVQEAELKRVKIGFTTSHPVSRMKALANANSQELAFLGFQLGDEKLEAKLHKKFGFLHRRNEWFEPGLLLMEYISNLRYGNELERELQKYVLAPGQRAPLPAASGGQSVLHVGPVLVSSADQRVV